MKNSTYYEILEVSEKASNEVIEKAYKVLAKKYHPDLYTGKEKSFAEEKMKEINYAYDVLGNEEKRKAYDAELARNREQEQRRREEQNIRYNQDSRKEQQAGDFYQEQAKNQNINGQAYSKEQSGYYNYQSDINKAYEKKLQKEELKQRKKMQENLNKEYKNAYEEYLRNLGYKVKHSWTKENIRDLIIVILIMLGIFLILWFIPPTHDWMVNFYEENTILKTIIDIIVAIVSGIFTGIGEFFKNLFN